jgi:hypothetical protein
MTTRHARLIPALAAFVLAAFVLATTAMAQSAPDFSGNWVLNNTKGKNLGMVAAVQEAVAVTQTADQLTLDIAATFQGNTSKRQVNYDLKGTPVQNEGAMGDTAETVAKWDGGKLVVTWTAEGAIAGTKTVKTETRSLSADGKTMTVVSQRGSNEPMELVYEKK